MVPRGKRRKHSGVGARNSPSCSTFPELPVAIFDFFPPQETVLVVAFHVEGPTGEWWQRTGRELCGKGWPGGGGSEKLLAHDNGRGCWRASQPLL